MNEGWVDSVFDKPEPMLDVLAYFEGAYHIAWLDQDGWFQSYTGEGSASALWMPLPEVYERAVLA